MGFAAAVIGNSFRPAWVYNALSIVSLLDSHYVHGQSNLDVKDEFDTEQNAGSTLREIPNVYSVAGRRKRSLGMTDFEYALWVSGQCL